MANNYYNSLNKFNFSKDFVFSRILSIYSNGQNLKEVIEKYMGNERRRKITLVGKFKREKKKICSIMFLLIYLF